MARGLNKTMLIGNVGRDPEVRTTGNGSKVANLSLATSRTWQGKSGGQQDRTEWHRLVIWGKLADVAEEYVRKGDRLYVEGRIEYGSYERDGVTIPTAEINVQEMVMLGSSSGAGPTRARSDDFEPDDDLPF